MKTKQVVSLAFVWSTFVHFASAQPSIVMFRPNSSDHWQPGATFRVQWEGTGIANIPDWSFTLWTNDVRVGFLFATPVNEGDGKWHADVTVPSDLPSACNYQLQVSEDVTDAIDLSEPFCLGVLVSATRAGKLLVAGAFTNGVCTIERAEEVGGAWHPVKNAFTTNTSAALRVAAGESTAFYRALARDLTGGRTGFTNLTLAYGLLTTIAGAGGVQNSNNWRPEFEGAPATNVLLSGPHIAMADRAGGIYIADKDAHGVRKIQLDGTLITVAGVNASGNGTDESAPGTQVSLNGPNGLWVRPDGTLFILDTGNGKVRRLGTNGLLKTLFTVPGGIIAGRGLWISDDESRGFISSFTVVKQWANGTVTDFATGFTQLGNLVVDASGNIVVADRGGHRVYRLDDQGNRTVIAGNGTTVGGGDGQLATNTALVEPRGVWFLPSGAFFVATHKGSQVWYVDTDGYIHLFLHGDHNGAHRGDGTWFYNPAEARVNDCRAITMDGDGNLLITENDVGYIRKIEFLPVTP